MMNLTMLSATTIDFHNSIKACVATGELLEYIGCFTFHDMMSDKKLYQ